MPPHPFLAAAPDQTALEITRLGLTALQASSSLFYWVEDGARMVDVSLEGLPLPFFAKYAEGMEETDPCNVRRLAAGRRSVTQLGTLHGAMPQETMLYGKFLANYGVADVIDLLFWSDGLPVAGIGILKRQDEPPVSQAMIDTATAIQRFVEFTLQTHERPARARRRRTLTNDYQLTEREIEVAELAASGLSNGEIAARLGTRLPTVKSHLLNIFSKTNCSSRTKLALAIGR